MKSVQQLNEIYRKADEVDKYEFPKQRSSILLTSGDHYAKRWDIFSRTVRENGRLNERSKIRLTKNHMQRIVKTYINNIVTAAPNVAITAKNQKELKNQKQAELNGAVWKDLCQKWGWDTIVQRLAYDYVVIGECFVKCFFNPNKGRLIAYEQVTDILGNPVFEADGSQKVGKPIYSGELELDVFYAFNTLRCPSAKSLKDSPYLIFRKMVDTKVLKKMWPQYSEEGLIKSTKDDTFLVFDGNRGTYVDTQDQTMVLEYYYRPSLEYPNGYYYIATEAVILEEGELPFGIFPIKHVGWDEIPTTARHDSLIKQLRPVQLELNRSASKIAETQMVAGDVKIVGSYGAKLENGAMLPGIRYFQTNGPAPTILPGQSGEQYFEYMQFCIEEMYQIANLDLEMMEKSEGALDPITFLFRSLRQKKAYSLYAQKFESFLVEIVELSLSLAKKYYNDQHLIPAIGMSEMINIEEFKSTDPLYYQIKVEPQSGDIETKMGKYMTIQSILQYAGSQLQPEQLGNLVRNMEYVNKEQIFEDATMNYDMAVNIILALDRGEKPVPRMNQPHEYILSKLVARTLKPDYQFLPEIVRANYEEAMAAHQELLAENIRKQQAAQAGLIPTTGYMVACDLYVPKADDPTKTQRARIPYDSLQWLIKKLEDQGTTMALESLPPDMQANILQPAQPMQPT